MSGKEYEKRRLMVHKTEGEEEERWGHSIRDRERKMYRQNAVE